MNEFDKNLGAYDHELGLAGLDGFFKKLKKKVKKAVKKVNKVRLKVYRKVTPKKLRKVVDKVANNKIIQGAALVGAAVVAGPAVMGAFSQMGGAAAGGVSKFVGSKVVRQGLKLGAQKAVKNMTKLQAKRQLQAANAQINQAAQQTAQTAQQVVTNPAFVDTVQTMEQRGLTPQQIISQWQQSQYYKDSARAAAMDAVEPIAYQQFVDQGVQPDVAEGLAADVALKASDNAVNKLDAKTLLTIAAPVAALLLLRG